MTAVAGEPPDPEEPQEPGKATPFGRPQPADTGAGGADQPDRSSLCDHTNCVLVQPVAGSLAEARPDLVEQWDCDGLGPTPWSVRPATDKKLHWIHLTTDGVAHRWTATGGSRTAGSGCGVCHPRRGASPGVNDLASRRPDLLDQWCTLHQARRPDEVTLGSNRLVCWACPTCGFHAVMRVSTKVAGNGCQRCAGQVALPGDPRTLAIFNPTLFSELDPASLPDGMDPLTLLSASNRVVGWTCRHCSATYPASPNARGNSVGCPHCTPQSSAIERDIRGALRNRMPGLEPGSTALPIEWDSGATHRPRRHRIRVDICHRPRRVVVEYDGYVYHRRDDIVLRDRTKTGLLLNHGWTVIRIRENQLPLLDLEHPRLRQVHHQWGSSIGQLVDQLVDLIHQLTGDAAPEPDPETGAES